MRAFALTFTIALLGLTLPAEGASTILSSTSGSPVNPSITNVFLEPGDALTVTICVTNGGAPDKLDVFLLEDLSGSFNDDLASVKASVPSLFSGVKAEVPDSLFGVGSFVDKPKEPFGVLTDYTYQHEQTLTADQTTFQNAVNALSILNGFDGPEAQLEALLQSALRTSEVGWRTDAFKTVVLSTDALYHEAGHNSAAGPNDLDTVVTSYSGGLIEDEDYPSVANIKAALEAAGIVPIFAVTSNVLSTYQTLVTDLGRGAVVELSANSSNLVAAILEGLGSVSNDISLVTATDAYGYVSMIDPTLYMDVPADDTVCFDVTLFSAGPVTPSQIVLVSPGFGTSVINVNGGPDTIVPEPSTFALLGLGVLGLGVVVRRRRKS